MMLLSSPMAYARTTVVAILRRRLTLAVLLALPLALYVVSHDTVGRSVRALTFGLSWALSTVSFFATSAAREIEPRLALAGWRPRALFASRLAGLGAFALGLAAMLWIVVTVDQPVRSATAVAVVFALTAIVAVMFGTTVGSVVTGELEGALVLFFFAGLQAVANPFDAYTRVLPFWSSRELGTWAIDGPEIGSLSNGVTHALVTIAVCATAIQATTVARAHRRHQPTDGNAPT